MSLDSVTRPISDLETEMKVETKSEENAKKSKLRRGRVYSPSLPCKHCGKAFTRKRTMRVHIKNVHLKIPVEKVEKQTNGEKIQCEQCDKIVKRRTDLKLHIKRAHLKIKDHICETCKKAFSTINELTTHEIVHKEKKFSCNICALKIRSKRSLVDHMERRHMGIPKKPYFCQDCGIHYSNTAHRRTHMDQTKLVKFPCETCGKQFGLNKNLKKHKKLHMEKDELISSKIEALGNPEEIDKMATLDDIKDDTPKSPIETTFTKAEDVKPKLVEGESSLGSKHSPQKEDEPRSKEGEEDGNLGPHHVELLVRLFKMCSEEQTSAMILRLCNMREERRLVLGKWGCSIF